MITTHSARAYRVHLQAGTHEHRALPPSWHTLFGGGCGLATRLISELPPDIAPLAPENPLILASGMLHGTGAVGAAGIFVSAISPLTNTLSHGWAEGEFGNSLHRAGVALLILMGMADAWSTVVITPNGIDVVPAAHLLGKDTVTTAIALQAEYGMDAHVLALGPAGEAGVAYAAPVVDGRYLLEPAGVGVVMAAKRIKAIVVSGGESVPVKDAGSMARLGLELAAHAESEPLVVDIRRFGSAGYINLLNDHGAVTARNGQDANFGGMLALSRSTLALRGKQEAHGSCPMHCHADFIQRGGPVLPRPDLEALLGFGVRCGIADLEVVLLANERCLRLGLDVTATANAIAFLMECQQRGLHRSPSVPWANGRVLLDLIEKIGRKEGIGGVLSLGVGEMQSIFWGSEAFAPQAHSGAMSPIDPRALPIMALHLATSTWSGDYRMALPLSGLLAHAPEHLPDFSRSSGFDGDVARLLWHERFAAAVDALGICRRWALLAYAVTPTDLAKLVSLATGTTWSSADLAKMGERIVLLERLVLTRSESSDTLPKRWQETPLGEGVATGGVSSLDKLLPLYYAAHGCDDNGRPTTARLRSLDLVS